MKRIFIVLVAVLSWFPQTGITADGISVLMYHRFGVERYPSTNIRLSQFEQHIDALLTGGYTVMPLSEAVRRFKANEPFPDKAVAITVDDAHVSVFAEAAPRLEAAGLPWTLFAATEPIDQGLHDFMSWDQVRELQSKGVEIGAHSHGHGHLADMTPDELERDFVAMKNSLERELGPLPELFAYPYGEARMAVLATVQAMGFTAAFGQHSGVASKAGPLFYLPRFPINERFGNPERFALVSSAKAVMARVDVNAIDVFNRTALDFVLTPIADGRLPNLTCFSGAGAVLETEKLDGPLRITTESPEASGRQRFNCTASAGDGRFYWIGHQYLVR